MSFLGEVAAACMIQSYLIIGYGLNSYFKSCIIAPEIFPSFFLTIQSTSKFFFFQYT